MVADDGSTVWFVSTDPAIEVEAEVLLNDGTDQTLRVVRLRPGAMVIDISPTPGDARLVVTEPGHAERRLAEASVLATRTLTAAVCRLEAVARQREGSDGGASPPGTEPRAFGPATDETGPFDIGVACERRGVSRTTLYRLLKFERATLEIGGSTRRHAGWRDGGDFDLWLRRAQDARLRATRGAGAAAKPRKPGRTKPKPAGGGPLDFGELARELIGSRGSGRGERE